MPVLTVCRDPQSPKRFAIMRLATGAILEGGFSSRSAAESYLEREYDAETGAAK